MKKIAFYCVSLFCLLLSISSHAETVRYVTEGVEITMRNGKGLEFAIRRMLSSGTRLTVLETDRAAGYAKVRTDGGTTGWVLTQYLTRPQTQEQKDSELKQKVLTLQQQLSDAKKHIADMTLSNETIQQKNQQLEKTLAQIESDSNSSSSLSNENKKLKAHFEQLEVTSLNLMRENKALRDNNDRTWFLLGAAVFFLGLVIGLIMPKLHVGKNKSW